MAHFSWVATAGPMSRREMRRRLRRRIPGGETALLLVNVPKPAQGRRASQPITPADRGCVDTRFYRIGGKAIGRTEKSDEGRCLDRGESPGCPDQQPPPDDHLDRCEQCQCDDGSVRSVLRGSNGRHRSRDRGVPRGPCRRARFRGRDPRGYHDDVHRREHRRRRRSGRAAWQMTGVDRRSARGAGLERTLVSAAGPCRRRTRLDGPLTATDASVPRRPANAAATTCRRPG